MIPPLLPSLHVLSVLFQCESVQLMLEGLGGQRGALKPQLEALEQDVSRLKEWASGLTETRAQLQSSLSTLRDAVGQIEERTSAITMDFSNKVQHIFIFSPSSCLLYYVIPLNTWNLLPVSSH